MWDNLKYVSLLRCLAMFEAVLIHCELVKDSPEPKPVVEASDVVYQL